MTTPERISTGVVRVRRNTAVENVWGFSAGTGTELTDNLATNNSLGVLIAGEKVKAARNIVSRNGQGFIVAGFRHALIENVISDNSPFVGIGFIGEGGNNRAHRNDIFGNADPRDNCGIQNQSRAIVLATNNYWGAPSGPGPNPADEACDVLPGSVTVVEPFATRPFSRRIAK